MTSSVFVLPGATVPDMEGFQAADRFKLASEGAVRIGYVGDNFRAWFSGLMVSAHAGSVIMPHTLARNAYDHEIIEALGGETRAETSLAELWYLMTLQGRGQEGVLLVNGYVNIFYVRDAEGVLRAVDVNYDASEWSVNASEIVDGSWLSERRVFARQPAV